MVLKIGEKLFFITRRAFEGDLRRHFVGEVLECTEFSVRVKGNAFIFDESTSTFLRREENRTRLFSLTDAGVIINVIPMEVNLEAISYQINEKNQRVITDGKAFKLNVSEFTANR
jgi:uncharacterized protein YjiK